MTATKGKAPLAGIVGAAELCERLGIGAMRYRALLRRGIPSMLVGGTARQHRRFDIGKVIAWLEGEAVRHTTPEPAPKPRRGRPHARGRG